MNVREPYKWALKEKRSSETGLLVVLGILSRNESYVGHRAYLRMSALMAPVH